MKSLQNSETLLIGKWIFQGNSMGGDRTCQRIDWLVKEELKEISTDASGWDVLYLNPADCRYWELTYPQSEMHGGGPPQLTHLSREQVKIKYGVIIPKNS